MRPDSRRFLGLSAVIASLAAAAHILRLPGIVVDDAFISYRYALQWVRGHGLVFNVGEYVEGYSNPLWVWLTALGMILRADPVAWTRSLGAAACLGCVILTAWQTWRLTRSRTASIAASLLLASATAFCSAAMSGLETGFFALFVTATAAFFISRRYLAASCAIALAGLTRPEGFAFLFVAAACLYVTRSKRDKIRLRVWLRLLAPALIAAFLLLAFRLVYYDALTPNSVVAKSAMFARLRLGDLVEWPGILLNQPGLAYVFNFFMSTLGPASILCVAPALLARSRRTAVTFLSIISTLGCAVAIYNFGDWMSSFRLLTPYLPIMTSLACWGAVLTLKRARESLQPIPASITKVIVPGLILIAPIFAFQRALPSESSRPDYELARLLESSKHPNLLAATDVLGRLGYFAPNIRIIDMAGLTDAFIARRGEPKPTFGKWHMAYVLSHRPDFLMTNVLSGWQDVLPRGEFHREYVWLDEPSFRKSPKTSPRYVFIRRGTILEQELKAAYPAAILRSPSRAAESVSEMAASSCAKEMNHAS